MRRLYSLSALLCCLFSPERNRGRHVVTPALLTITIFPHRSIANLSHSGHKYLYWPYCWCCCPIRMSAIEGVGLHYEAIFSALDLTQFLILCLHFSVAKESVL